MTLSTIIILVLALYLAQLFLQETSGLKLNVSKYMGPRDEAPKLSVSASRLERAKNNMMESLPMFLGIALLTLATGAETQFSRSAALVFLIARTGYIPAYLSGIPMARSFFWVLALVSLVAMAWPLI